MILYLKNLNSTRKLKPDKHFQSSIRIQNQNINTTSFLYANNELAEKEISEKNSHSQSFLKTI